MKNLGPRWFVIVVLVAMCSWALAANSIKYGLDLAGGASLAYRIEADGGQPVDKEHMQRLIGVLSSRLNASGLMEINIVPTDDEEILIEIPGRDQEQVNQIETLLTRNGELEFRIVVDETTMRTERQKRADAGEALYEAPENTRWVPASPGKELDAEGNLVREFEKPDVLVMVPEMETSKQVARLEAKKERTGKLSEKEEADLIRLGRERGELRNDWLFTGDQLAKTSVVRDQKGQWVVTFEFKTERMAAFGKFTGDHVKRQMAIILDGSVDSAPVIQDVLPGRGQISGGGNFGFAHGEATELSIVLESGATGVTLTQIRKDQLGPTLGEDAIQRGKLSIIGGFVCVLLMMAWFYRLPGMVANVALLLNIVILAGALAFFHAALSLPGIAGIVLTLGMAVDANILIFERLKEERQRGKSLVEALAAGYDRALVAIVDANATTILTALVLIGIGSGAVKGFGVTLTVGILASMFTAIYVTRTVFEWAIASGVLKDLKFGAERNVPKYDFMKVRRFFTGPTLAFMVIGFAFFLSRDEADSKDLEFIGGQQVIVQFSEPMEIADVRALVAGEDGTYNDARIVALDAKGVDTDSTGRVRFQISVKASDKAEGEAFLGHIQTAFADKFVPPRFQDFAVTKASDAPAQVTAKLNSFMALTPTQVDDLKKSLGEVAAFSGVSLEAVAGSPKTYDLSLASTLEADAGIQDNIAKAADSVPDRIILSDPMPAVSFLNPSRAEELWRGAMEAVLLAMVFQVLYIRLRFQNYSSGVAAVCALVHDSVIALGCVAIFDAAGLIHAKVNLVLVAAFLTLIGYSMNDTIVVFDRIRENLGKGRLVLSGVVNDSLNQTLTRSIRTSLTTWVVVLLQFAFNWGSGSVLEGFAFVMVVGVLMGTYSSIFIAAPLLLFVPIFWKKFAVNKTLAGARIAASGVGALMALTSQGHNIWMYVGVALMLNVVVEFMVRLYAWLGVENPDALLAEEMQAELDQRPLVKPGI